MRWTVRSSKGTEEPKHYLVEAATDVTGISEAAERKEKDSRVEEL